MFACPFASFSTHYGRPSYVPEKGSRTSVPNSMYKLLINNFNCLLIMVQSQNLLVSFAVINKSFQHLCFHRREAFKGFSRPKRSAATMWCTATNVKGKQRRRVWVVRNVNRRLSQDSGGSRPVLIGGPGWGRFFCWGAHRTQEKKTNPSFRQGIGLVFTISAILIG